MGAAGNFTHENPCGNSGTTKPAAWPDVPRFPQRPKIRGHNSGKVRKRAGTIVRSPAGTEEVAFSGVPMAEQSGGADRKVVEWRRGGVPEGSYERLGGACFDRTLPEKMLPDSAEKKSNAIATAIEIVIRIKRTLLENY